MATNPMQRKARNSFLLGMLVTLIIAGAIIALLMLQILNQKKEEKEEKLALANVYVLNQDVSSGQVITEDMLETKTVSKTMIPSNATSDSAVFKNFSLQDKEGNNVYTKVDSDGNAALFIKRNDQESQIKQEASTQNYYIDKCPNGSCVYIEKDNNERISLYLKLNDVEYQLKDNNGNPVYIKYGENNENIYYTVRNNAENVLSENPNINFKANTDSSIKLDQLEKQYIELNSVPLVAKVTMKKNTVMTTEMISKSDSQVQNDVRKQEYNTLVLPVDLTSGDYIDIRFMLPSGQDYIVVSKKEVQLPTIDGVDSTDTIWVNLSEDEILHMSCAIYEAYRINGSKLYATKYTEAGMQEAAKVTYPANQGTLKLLENDPNVLDKAMTELASRYRSESVTALRNDYINSEINKDQDQADSNIQTKMQESITKSETSRKSYLESLAGVVD